MSWRTVVISSRAKLDLRLNYLVVRKEEETKIHLSEIGMLIIESTAVSLTAALLCELNKRKIKIIFCDEKRNPYGEICSYYGSHDTSDKIRNQIQWDGYIKGMVWTEIVSEKIRKQSNMLQKIESPMAEALIKYVQEIEYRDATNREGHAAKVYFNAMFGLDFSRSIDNVTNAALNYGYSILLSAFNREIVANGYLTQLGLFHDNMFNQFNLSSDLMEPFRVLVDEIVYNNKFEKFEHEEKMIMVDVLNMEIMMDNSRQYVNNAIKIYCRSIFEALENQDISLMRFYYNEL